jgi:hypothetical protein
MMLNKLFGKKQPTQSISTGNITAINSKLNQENVGRDSTTDLSGPMAIQQQGLTGTEVIALLEQLRGAIESSSLTADQKEELQDYLKAAKREAGKESPDKELIGKNLKNVGETMKNLKETTEAGKSLWQTGAEVFKAIAPWVGVATAFFGV